MKTLLFMLALLPLSLPLSAQVYKADETRSGGIRIIDGNEERPVSTTKRLTFWVNSTAHGPIKVYVNGHQVGTITRAYSSEPKCGVSGCANYTVDRTPSSWYGVAADGTRYASDPITFRTGCNLIFLYPAGRTNDSGSSTGSGGSTSSQRPGSSSHPSGSSSLYTEQDRQWAEKTGAQLGNIVGTILSSGSGWDTYCNRIDAGFGWGIGYGGLGVKINYQAPAVFGVTAGFGYNTGYDSKPGNNKKFLWNAGLQFWCTDHWNFEIGAGPRYFKKYDDTQIGISFMTHYQHQIWGRLGIIGGIGGSLSTKAPEGFKKGDVAGRFEWNIGLVVRLLSD